MATLIETILDLKSRDVTMRVRLLVQGFPHVISCVAAEAALLARAQAAGRPDWNSADCAAAATDLVGQAVTLPE